MNKTETRDNTACPAWAKISQRRVDLVESAVSDVIGGLHKLAQMTGNEKGEPLAAFRAQVRRLEKRAISALHLLDVCQPEPH